MEPFRGEADSKSEDARPDHGVGGPPWILGQRGAAHEAPENTLAALSRAVELGLDGFEYDLQACATGEPVLLHDETLERTTDATGPVSLRSLPELAGIDAGGWFHKRFAGEPLPLLEEVLELPGHEQGSAPMHTIELEAPSLCGEVARQLERLARPLSVRVASFQRSVCLEARDLDLRTMLLAYSANEDDRRFVRDERIDAYCTAPGGWGPPAGQAEWDCEAWSWSLDEPDDLLEACRRPLFGFNTNEPRRALAVRALVHQAPHDDGPYPLQIGPLEVRESLAPEERGLHGEWTGRWRPRAHVRNPFPVPVEFALAIQLRGGAFETDGLPFNGTLEPREERAVEFDLTGGSWSPGEDPTLFLRFVWRSGPGRPREDLLLDAPLARVRSMRLGRDPRRVVMLSERRGEVPASMIVRRRGNELLARVEDSAGADEVRAIVRLGQRVFHGGRGVRAWLPENLDTEPPARGLPFSVGFEGRSGSARGWHLRRWSGGLPAELGAGAPGRLFLRADG